MSEHWYDIHGQPHHRVEKKSGSGQRATTIKDARENGWLPSVTSILKCINKPMLEKWKMMQACTAVLTSPRREGEDIDAFMERVLFQDEEQKQEAAAAADKGTAIHDAIELCIQGKEFNVAWKPYVEAVLPVIASLGKIVWTEKILVGDGYAGRSDILLETDLNLTLLDFKSSKKLPKESYAEHKMQTAAYAKTLGNVADKHIITGNLYISTVLPGATSLSLQEDWAYNYEQGFVSAMRLWQYLNSYRPGGSP